MYHGNVFSEFSGKETVETFHEKEIHKTRKKEFKTEKVIRRKEDCTSKGKALIIHSKLR